LFLICFEPLTQLQGQNQQTAELEIDAKATLGEGSIWDSRNSELCGWTIEQSKLYIYSPALNKACVEKGWVQMRYCGVQPLTVYNYCFETRNFCFLAEKIHH